VTKTDPRQALAQLGLHGVLSRFDEVRDEPWLDWLIEAEEQERHRRSLERRIRSGKLGRFKPMSDFDWAWPTRIDRGQVEALLRLDFLAEGANPILIGPNGIGKSMIARNVAYQALLAGHTVRFVTAGAMLGDLAAQDGASALRRHIARYTRPRLLIIDEIGYLTYSSRYADLLFEVITRRYDDGHKPILITTNRIFSEWNEVFLSASCVVTLVDRLVHRSEVLTIEGKSYRLKEAEDTAQQRARARTKGKTAGR
jgi:DNA replication protein DnaC